MKLLTKELISRFEEIGHQKHHNPILVAKLVAPFNSDEWYLVNYFPEDNSFAGFYLHENGCLESCFFSEKELKSFRFSENHKVERDEKFTEIHLSLLLHSSSIKQLIIH